MATLATLKNAIYKAFQGITGKSLNIDLDTIGGNTDDAEYFQHAGFHSRPQDGINAVVLDVNGLNIAVATHDYKFDKSLDRGETLLYSYDANGVVLSSVKLNKDGEFVVNDGTDFAVKYTELKKVVEELQNDITDLKTAFTNWVVAPQDGGLALKTATTTWFGNPIVENMTATKSGKVKIP